jgi:hypothetical protein
MDDDSVNEEPGFVLNQTPGSTWLAQRGLAHMSKWATDNKLTIGELAWVVVSGILDNSRKLVPLSAITFALVWPT